MVFLQIFVYDSKKVKEVLSMKRKFFALMLCLFLSFGPIAGSFGSADDGIAPCHFFEDAREGH